MRLKLILFDLDGVLIESWANMEIAWAAVKEKFPEAPAFEDYFENIGRPFADIMEILGLGADASEIERIFKEASAANMDACQFFPGVLDVLKRLDEAGAFLGVVTSKDAERTSIVLAKAGIGFAHIGTPTGDLRGKPAPDHLLKAMPLAQADPSETIYVGDMPVDAEAARRAGCHYAQASWGYGEVPGAEIVLDCPEDMLGWIS